MRERREGGRGGREGEEGGRGGREGGRKRVRQTNKNETYVHVGETGELKRQKHNVVNSIIII